MPDFKNSLKLLFFEKRHYLLLFLIFAVATALRLYFYSGNVFSDDAYAVGLGYSLFSGDYGAGYTGYPIALLRKLQSGLIAFSFLIFGPSEFSSVLPPLVFSLMGIWLIYRVTYIISLSIKTSLLAALLLCFFPPDIAFATINFADPQSTFFINLGVYFLIKAYKFFNIKYSLLAGISFGFSIFIKSNIYFLIPLGIIILLYTFYFNRNFVYIFIIPLLIPLLFLIIESSFYLLAKNDFFYRLTLLGLNYDMTYYNFFPYTVGDLPGNFWEYLIAVFKQIIAYNSRYLFFRRFYLFVPFFSLLISIFALRRQDSKTLIIWFVGLSVFLMSMTTSFSDYKPLDLRNSWYAFLVFMPALIILAVYLGSLKIKIAAPVIVLFIIFGLMMTDSYRRFFDVPEKERLKDFLRQNSSSLVYTDHHTRYGVKLIDSYRLPDRTRRIDPENVSFSSLSGSDYILLNLSSINEQRLQGFPYEGLEEILDDGFASVNKFGKFSVYKRNMSAHP